MVANNLIEIFTLLAGWGMYNTVWDILRGTGIAFIPFFMLFINAFVSSRDPLRSIKGAQAELEFDLVAMVLVLIFCVLPYNGVGSTTIGDFEYQIQTPYCSGTEQLGHSTSGDADSTGTSLDSGLGAAAATMSGSPPLGWSAVMIASTAFTNASITGLSCVNNYNYLLSRIADVSIEGGNVTERIESFVDSCFQPALSQFQSAELTVTNDMLHQPNWIGNYTFLNTSNAFYQSAGSNMSFVEGDWDYTAADTDDPTDTPDNVIVSCKEVWEGVTTPLTGTTVYETSPPGAGLFTADVPQSLREHILNSVPDDSVGSIKDDWINWGFGVFKDTATLTEKEDMLVALILANGAERETLSGRQVTLVNEGFYERGAGDVVGDSIAAMGASLDYLFKGLEHRVLKIASQYIAVFLQMLIIIAAPMYLVANGYTFSSFLSLAMMWFGLEFLNFIWALVEWFEIHLKDMILAFDGPNGVSNFLSIVGLAGATDSFIKSARLDLIVANAIPYYLQIILPIAWLGLISNMGSNIRQGMQGAGDGAGAQAGGASIGKKIGSTAGTVATKGLGAGAKAAK